jgi:hypothetical protein
VASRQRAVALAIVVLGAAGCGQFVQYTDELTDPRTGRTAIVTTPANLGGVLGFVAGIPLDVAAIPVTYAVYSYQAENDPAGADPLSTMLFPSFLLWRAGCLLAVPFDAVEHVVYRAWRSPHTRTREEREEIEFLHDERALPSYPAVPLYPTDEWRARVADDSGRAPG